mmetsp:Transcript_4897/g.10701  ORF Transcript_4897/g.10701 Transcript_4897/m.10701 type:complete len:234 (+) Transcript_4897:1625-2326(+)
MYFSRNGRPSASFLLTSITLSSGRMFIARSTTCWDKSGVRTSIPQLIVALFARRTSHWCNRIVLRRHSAWNSLAFGALWKYKYPPNNSSAPSPESTILNPMALMWRLNKYMGTEARTCSNVSRCHTTSLSASNASAGVKCTSWWIVPSWSATFLAAIKSGAPLIPIEKECTGSSRPYVFVAFLRCRTAMEVIRDESRPPDKSTAYGTSAIKRFVTASTTVSRISAKSAGFVGK